VGSAGLPLAEGGERFYAEIARRGAAPVALAAGIDHGNGTYRFEYVLTRAGSYALAVMHSAPGGALAHIEGSPWGLTVVPAAVSVAHSVARGDGLTLATAGTPAAFALLARDRFGNEAGPPPLAASPFAVSLGAAPSHSAAAELTPLPGATIALTMFGAATLASYNATRAGNLTLRVAPAGGGGTAAHFALRVRPARLSTRLSAMAAPLAAVAGERALLPLAARDAFGNPAGAADIAAALPPLGRLAVHEAAGGSVAVEVFVTAAGAYQLHVHVLERVGPAAGAALAGAPFALKVRAGPPSPADCAVAGAFRTAWRAGRPARLELHVRDSFGNAVSLNDSNYANGSTAVSLALNASGARSAPRTPRPAPPASCRA
jgi:hypothetical protein